MTDPTSQNPDDQPDDSDRLAELRALPSWEEPEAYRGSIGRTMFDTPGAKDNTLTVLLPTDSLQLVPAQSLVRIDSYPDGARLNTSIITDGVVLCRVVSARIGDYVAVVATSAVKSGSDPEDQPMEND